MGNILLAFPDRVLDSASYVTQLTEGVWSSEYPLTNIKDAALSVRARSVNVYEESTYFYADLMVPRSIRVLSILRHNFTSSATVRFRGYSDSTYTTLEHDTGTLPIWSEGYPTEENRMGYTADFYHVLATEVTARYWLVEIVNVLNYDGYVEFARCMFMSAFEPTINANYGASIGLETETSSSRSLGGVDYFNRREPRRVVQFSLTTLTESEAMASIFDMRWDRGLDREVLFCLNNGSNIKKTTFLGRMRQLNTIEFPYYNNYSTAFEIAEVL